MSTSQFSVQIERCISASKAVRYLLHYYTGLGADKWWS